MINIIVGTHNEPEATTLIKFILKIKTKKIVFLY